MVILEFIKEYIESIRNKRKIRKIYNGNPPTHQGCEDVKNGVDVHGIKMKLVYEEDGLIKELPLDKHSAVLKLE